MKIARNFLALFAILVVSIPALAANAVAEEKIALEAEPEEKFKACPLYGPGFVYIPGTETCIKISGSVRTTLSVPVGK